MPGDHTLDQSILVSDTASFTMRGRFNSTVTSSRPVGFYFRNISHVIIHTLTFTSSSRRLSQSNEHHYIFSNAVQASLVQHLEINNCTFQENYCTAVRLQSSSVVLEGTNTFKNNCLHRMDSCFGAGIMAVKSSLSLNGNNTFVGNSAEGGGGLFIISTITASGENSFVDNSAISRRGGGGIFAYKSALRFFGTTNFKHNSAKVSNGGGIHLLESTLYISGIAVFEGNSAHGKGIRSLYLDSGCGGGMFATRSSIIFAGRSTFLKDSSESCGGLLVYNSTMKVNGSIQFHNNSVAYHGGGGCVVYSNVSVSGNSTSTGNHARHNGGCVYIRGSNVSFSGNNSLHSSVAGGKGAAIILFESNLNFSGNSSFADNFAALGSVIHTANGIAQFDGNTTFSANIATLSGSGVYSLDSSINFDGVSSFVENWVRDMHGVFHLSNSTLCFTGNSRFSHNRASNGGVIYATMRSKIQFHGHSTFVSNLARQDGGVLYLTGNSKCYLWPQASYESIYPDYDYDCFFHTPSTKVSQNTTEKKVDLQIQLCWKSWYRIVWRCSGKV